MSAKMQRVNAAENIRIESARLEKDDDSNSDDEDNIIDPSLNNHDDSLANENDENEIEANEISSKRDKYMSSAEAKAQIERLWKHEPFLCHCLFGGGSPTISSSESFAKYFMQAIPVPPSRFRPPMFLSGMSVEHAQTAYLSKIILANAAVRDRLAADESAYTACINLQAAVNCYIDTSKDPSSSLNVGANGIRQILERKEGLFRKNMMGKRVNHACRSVISPDPYVGTNEIGLPRYFAEVLTYPTPVNDWNCNELRKAVERGPKQYPAARWVEVDGNRRVDLSKMNSQQRQAVAAQLLKGVKSGKPVIVGRQLRDGDYVLMNRQVRLIILDACVSNVVLGGDFLSCTTPIKI